jgi:hypothetical protein
MEVLVEACETIVRLLTPVARALNKEGFTETCLTQHDIHLRNIAREAAQLIDAYIETTSSRLPTWESVVKEAHCGGELVVEITAPFYQHVCVCVTLAPPGMDMHPADRLLVARASAGLPWPCIAGYTIIVMHELATRLSAASTHTRPGLANLTALLRRDRPDSDQLLLLCHVT